MSAGSLSAGAAQLVVRRVLGDATVRSRNGGGGGEERRSRWVGAGPGCQRLLRDCAGIMLASCWSLWSPARHPPCCCSASSHHTLLRWHRFRACRRDSKRRMDEDYEYEDPRGAKRASTGGGDDGAAARARFGIRAPGQLAAAQEIANMLSESEASVRHAEQPPAQTLSLPAAAPTWRLIEPAHRCHCRPRRVTLTPTHRLPPRSALPPLSALQEPYPVGEGGMRLAGLAGHLKKIEVVNFMCHENFAMDFGAVSGRRKGAYSRPLNPCRSQPAPAGRRQCVGGCLHLPAAGLPRRLGG